MFKYLALSLIALLLISSSAIAQLNENVLQPNGNAGIGTEIQTPGVLEMLHIHQPWPQTSLNTRRPALRLSYMNKSVFGQMLIEPFNGQSGYPRSSVLSHTNDLILRTGSDLDHSPAGNIIISSQTRGGAIGLSTTPTGPGSAVPADMLRVLITQDGNVGMGADPMPGPLNLQSVRDKLHVNVTPGPNANSEDSRGITLTHGQVPLVGDPLFSQWAIEAQEGTVADFKLSSFSSVRDVVFRSGLPLELHESPQFAGAKGNLILTSQRMGSSIIFGTSPLNAEPVDGSHPDLERMRITASGTVGIGTSTPAQKLHVNGSLRLSGGQPAPALGTVIEGASRSRLSIYTNTDGHNGRNFIEMWDEHDPARLGELALGGTYIDFRTNTNGASNGNFGRPHVRIAANGNVGIGAIGNLPPNTANARLEVNSGMANISGLRFTNLTSASPVTLATGTALTVNAQGDVVLTTTGNGGNGTPGFLPKWSSTGSLVTSLLFERDNVVLINSQSAPPIKFADGQDFKLAVNGAIFAREIVVKTDWSDYVFDEKYKLMSLEELESYILCNKHLPEVITAQEVAIHGVGLATNQSTLLRKIEELTLHIIAMSKEIKALKTASK